MITVVNSKKDLKKFVYYVQSLYQTDSNYVYPMFRILYKELYNEILIQKKYRALLCLQNGKIVGRLLYTFEHSEKYNKKVCYFSFFDAVDDTTVARELFNSMQTDMKEEACSYAEGTFTPYDPDTRRGLLISGFTGIPSLFTSYNYAYYEKLMDACGFSKVYDTYSLQADISAETTEKVEKIARFIKRRYPVTLEPLNLKKLEKEIHDIHHILNIATTEENYQDAPSIEMIARVAKKMRLFLDRDMIIIAREEETREPIGFCLVLPDFNQVFHKTKGRVSLLKFLYYKNKITRARGIMQYVIPKYQSTGLIGAMFHEVYKNFKEKGITEFEAGTILEHNIKSLSVFDKFGGKIIKTYRIYGKDV